MKILATAALASAISAAVLATPAIAVGPQATLVFQGTVPSVIPSGDHTITGPGGSALPQGTLQVAANGAVTTINPVTFEVHTYTGGTAGSDAKTEYKVTLVSSTLTAGAATTDNSKNVVTLNGEALKPGATSTAISQTQSSVTFANDAGFTVADVGAGGVVEAKVIIIIEPPTATSPPVS